VQAELASATERAGQAEARAGEIERRADGLQAELGRVHENARAEQERQAAAIVTGQAALDGVREELASLRATAQAEVRQHAEAERLADTLAKIGIDRDEARQEAADARENAARLQGQVEAMTAQQGELMKAIAAKAERPPSGRAPK